jgi:DNA polymerase phi
MPLLRDAILDVMSFACKDSATLTTSQMKDLFKLSLLAVRQTKRSQPIQNDCSKIWQPTPWDILRNSLAATERFRGSTSLQRMCQQMIQTSSSLLACKSNQPEVKLEATARKRKKEGNDSGDEAVPIKTRRKKDLI